MRTYGAIGHPDRHGVPASKKSSKNTLYAPLRCSPCTHPLAHVDSTHGQASAWPYNYGPDLIVENERDARTATWLIREYGLLGDDAHPGLVEAQENGASSCRRLRFCRRSSHRRGLMIAIKKGAQALHNPRRVAMHQLRCAARLGRLLMHHGSAWASW